MNIFPKKLIQWREPKSISQLRYEQFRIAPAKKWLGTVLCLVLLWLSLMVKWLAAYLNPEKNPAPLGGTLLISLVFIVFCASLIWLGYWISLRTPRKVMLYANKICFSNPGGEFCTKINDITECVISSVITNEGTMPLLVVNSNKTSFNVGIPPDMVSKITDILTSIGITVKQD